MRRVRLLLLPMLSLAWLAAPAQSAAAPPPAIKLGDSFAALPGPWKFAPGDSPQANGVFLWANPTFHDAAWTDMDLHARPAETDAAYGNSGYVSGWSAHGFPHLSGFAWYRLRLHIADAAEPLWLKMPDHVDDAYQVFANGKFLGEFGRFVPKRVTCYRSRPLSFQLPPPDEHGDVQIAIRFYLEPFVLAGGTTPDSGGMHQAPLVGLHSQIESIRAGEVTWRRLSIITGVFVAFMMLIGAAAAFWLWLLDRSDSTYLWLTFSLVFTAGPVGSLLIAFFTYVIDQDMNSFSVNTFATSALVCWIYFWRHWFQLAGNRRLNLLVAFLVALIFGIELFTNFSHSADATFVLHCVQFRAALDVILGALIFDALVRGARKDRTGALLALPPIVLLAISIFSLELLTWFRIRTSFFPFGIQIGVKDVASVLLILVVGALVARRFIGSQVSQRLDRQTLDQDLEHARELQERVLIPEPIASPLFRVETAYYPARTVGGDFFQVIPHADGSLLVVVGDVSGKGMAAAMLVAVLVGTARTRADETFDPAAILHSLNDRMLGRSGDHFATCIVAHIRPGGFMLIANAGHIPPYRNGVAMELPGAIPLGIIPGTQYNVHAMQLDPADHLTFVTDGIPEARNASGLLLGFDELAELSSLPPDAIAQAAIRYGQEDDITIVSVSLRGALQAAESSAVFAASPA